MIEQMQVSLFEVKGLMLIELKKNDRCTVFQGSLLLDGGQS
jgi:hypothetical protein